MQVVIDYTCNPSQEPTGPLVDPHRKTGRPTSLEITIVINIAERNPYCNPKSPTAFSQVQSIHKISRVSTLTASYFGYFGGFTVTRLILFVLDSGATPRGHRLVRIIAT